MITLNENETNAILDVIAKAKHTEKTFAEVYAVVTMLKNKWQKANEPQPVMAEQKKDKE